VGEKKRGGQREKGGGGAWAQHVVNSSQELKRKIRVVTFWLIPRWKGRGKKPIQRGGDCHKHKMWDVP